MKKKGFTLIELLAVIVILAIIAIIATPIILGVIDNARKGAAKESFNGYLDALELALLNNEENNSIKFVEGNYYVTKDTLLNDTNYLSLNQLVSIKGSKPTGEDDYIKLDKSKRVEYAELTILGYKITYKGGKIESINKANEVTLTDIELNYSEQTMEKGSTFELHVTFKPSNATNQDVTYKSSDESIVTVDENGLVTALKNGNVKITVTSEANKNIKKECNVTVIVSATGVTLNKESEEIYVGEKLQLEGILEPNDVTTNALSWSSSNPLVANVDENGLVTGMSEGEAIITATTINGKTANCNIKVNKLTNYTYSYDSDTPYYTFTAPIDGTYKIELWGAQGGGTTSYPGGLGAYTEGLIKLNKNDILYFYIGESGNNSTDIIYNNGNKKTSAGNSIAGYGDGYSGGGSTDVRLVNGEWNSISSLNSRIMVAAAGGGSNTYAYPKAGGNAGGLIGYSGLMSGSDGQIPTGGNQTAGGNNGKGSWGSSIETAGFGIPTIVSTGGIGLGGNGYYAGGNAPNGSGTVGSGAGGSSYISGHTGCVAIISATDQTPKTGCTTGTTNQDCSVHYSNYQFTNTSMIDGKGYSWTNVVGTTVVKMPTHDGTATMTGNTGNGYAKITFVST